MSYTLVGISIIASGACSWYFSRLYYLKSIRNQSNEAQKEIARLVDVFQKNQDNDLLLEKQQYIDNAVAAWKQRGTPEFYLNSLSQLSSEEKYEIHCSASLRHKGREPKRNPYI